MEPSEVIPAESGARFRAGVARTAVVARTGADARTDVAAQTGVVARTGVLARGRAGEVPNPYFSGYYHFLRCSHGDVGWRCEEDQAKNIWCLLERGVKPEKIAKSTEELSEKIVEDNVCGAEYSPPPFDYTLQSAVVPREFMRTIVETQMGPDGAPEVKKPKQGRMRRRGMM